MIERNKISRKQEFSVLDIETDKDGNMLAMASFDGINLNRFYCWQSYFQFLKDNNHKKEYQHIFGHYAGGFDYVHMLESNLIEMDKVKIITAGSDIIFIDMLDFKKRVRFCDSFKTLLSGLKKLCVAFEVETPKQDIDINRIGEIFVEDPDQFWNYLEHDVYSLYEVMIKFMQLLEIEFFPTTAASLAFRIFKQRYLPEGIKLLKASLKPDDKTDEFITFAYAGGRVECFRPGVHDKVWVYDINSLYPKVMADLDIPDCTPKQVNKYVPGERGFFHIKFNQHNRNLPPVLWQKTKNGLEFMYEGEGVFSDIEIDKALEVGTTIDCTGGLIYLTTEKVFKYFVTELYKLRMDNKGNAIDYICKIILNSSYGKFAQREETESLQKLSIDEYRELLSQGELVTIYDMEKLLFTVKEHREIENRLIHVAAFITSAARVELYNYIQRYSKHLVYCDTDSVHLTKPMAKKWEGKALGKMKEEQAEVEGVYIGRKMYATGEEIKFKGAPLRSSLPHDTLNIDDLKAMWNKDIIEFKYNIFPKLKSMLRGAKAAKMKPIKKNLKRGNYLSNFVPND